MDLRGTAKTLRKISLTVGISVLVMTATAYAGTYQTIDDSSPQEVVNGMANKTVRGITNIATGWLEFPKQIYLTFRDDGAVKGIFVGPFKGLGMTLVRTFAGAGEVLTFYSAYPGFYDPLIEPEYAWQKE